MFTASIGGSTKTSNLSASDHRHDRRQCAVVVPQLVPLRLPKLRHEEDHHWDEEEDCHTPYHHNGKKTQAYAKTDVGQPRVDSVDSAVAVVSPSSTADSCSIANAGGGERTEKEGEVEESSHYYHRIIDIVDSSDDVEDGNGGRKSHRWQRPPSATPSTTPTTTMTVVNHNANNNNTSSSRSETVTVQQPKTTKKNNGKAVSVSKFNNWNF
jgi:hypothetical protein